MQRLSQSSFIASFDRDKLNDFWALSEGDNKFQLLWPNPRFNSDKFNVNAEYLLT